MPGSELRPEFMKKDFSFHKYKEIVKREAGWKADKQ